MQDCTSIDAPFEVYDASSDSSVKGLVISPFRLNDRVGKLRRVQRQTATPKLVPLRGLVSSGAETVW